MKHVSLIASISLVTLLCATTSCSQESAAPGSSATRLALSKPANQQIAQGESKRVAVSVKRTGVPEPVQVTFSNLPEGVRVVDEVIPVGDSSRDFVLMAAPTAGLVEKHIVTVRAKGSSITTSQTFELTVKARS